jgi:large subunit ribosomal protein L25
MAKHVVVHHDPIVAEARTASGTRKARAIRKEGKIPAVLYGLGKEAVSIALPHSQTEAILRSGAHTADLTLNGKTDKVLIQDVQYDYLQKEIEHIDLLRIDANQKVRVKVALDFRGTPKGAKEGGILETQLNELELEVLATDIPSDIRVNVEDMALDAVLHAKDIVLPKGAKLIDNPERIVAAVSAIKEVEAIDLTTATAEPEVIGKKPEEGDADAAAPAKGGGKK